MNFDNQSPIYLQVVNEMKKQIVAGNILPGDKLPSSRELAIQYKINPNTSAHVYQVLESEGLTYTKRGLGTYVIEENKIVQTLKSEMAQAYVQSYLREMERLGYTKEEMIEFIRKGELNNDTDKSSDKEILK